MAVMDVGDCAWGMCDARCSSLAARVEWRGAEYPRAFLLPEESMIRMLLLSTTLAASLAAGHASAAPACADLVVVGADIRTLDAARPRADAIATLGSRIVAVGDEAGVRVERIRFLTYVMCAMLAALCGFLFSGFSGGSSLSMGEQYLLASIAVVVIGGTSVAGGSGNVAGLWGAALFLFLLQSMLNTYQLSAGLRYLTTGLIIIARSAGARSLTSY